MERNEKNLIKFAQFVLDQMSGKFDITDPYVQKAMQLKLAFINEFGTFYTKKEIEEIVV